MPVVAGAWLQTALSAEARVMTPRGPRAAGLLAPGDLVLTVDHGALPLQWVGRRALSTRQMVEQPALAPILVPRNAFSGGNPRLDLRLSPLAGILLNLPGGPPEGVLIEAREMVGLKGIQLAPARPVTYVQLLLERHAILAADGLAIESFHPNVLQPEPANSSQRAEILACFPGLEHDLDLFGPEARLRAERAR